MATALDTRFRKKIDDKIKSKFNTQSTFEGAGTPDYDNNTVTPDSPVQAYTTPAHTVTEDIKSRDGVQGSDVFFIISAIQVENESVPLVEGTKVTSPTGEVTRMVRIDQYSGGDLPWAYEIVARASQG